MDWAMFGPGLSIRPRVHPTHNATAERYPPRAHRMDRNTGSPGAEKNPELSTRRCLAEEGGQGGQELGGGCNVGLLSHNIKSTDILFALTMTLSLRARCRQGLKRQSLSGTLANGALFVSFFFFFFFFHVVLGGRPSLSRAHSQANLRELPQVAEPLPSPNPPAFAFPIVRSARALPAGERLGIRLDSQPVPSCWQSERVNECLRLFFFYLSLFFFFFFFPAFAWLECGQARNKQVPSRPRTTARPTQP